MTPLTFRPLAVTACAVIAAVVSAGCDSGQGGEAGPMSAPPTAPTSVISSPVSSPAPAPSSIQSARDGSNYKACLGGDCEVAVSKPVTFKLFTSRVDGGPLTVRKVNAGSVVVGMDFPVGANVETTIDEGCSATFIGNSTDGAAITSCERKPEAPWGFPIKQTVTVKSITDGTAILELEPG